MNLTWIKQKVSLEEPYLAPLLLIPFQEEVTRKTDRLAHDPNKLQLAARGVSADSSIDSVRGASDEIGGMLMR